MIKRKKIDAKDLKGIDLTKVTNVPSIDVQPTFIEIEFEIREEKKEDGIQKKKVRK